MISDIFATNSARHSAPTPRHSYPICSRSPPMSRAGRAEKRSACRRGFPSETPRDVSKKGGPSRAAEYGALFRPTRSGSGPRSGPPILLLCPIHHKAGGGDHLMRAGAVAGKTILDAVGRHHRDPLIAVLSGADDGFVVARNGPSERLFGVGDRAREATPNEPALLALNGERCLEIAHPRRIGKRVWTRMMGIVAEDE